MGLKILFLLRKRKIIMSDNPPVFRKKKNIEEFNFLSSFVILI